MRRSPYIDAAAGGETEGPVGFLGSSRASAAEPASDFDLEKLQNFERLTARDARNS